MPNEVYKAAVKGLGALVAPKAARRLVDEALRSSRRTADDVSESAMRRLLQTRVKRELRGILPDHVLEASLERVSSELSTRSEPQRRGLFGRRSRPATGQETRKSRSKARDGDRESHERAEDQRRHSPEAALQVDPFASDELDGDMFGGETPNAEQLDRSVKKSSVYLPAVDLPEFLPTDQPAVDGVQAPHGSQRRDQPRAAQRDAQRAHGLTVTAAQVEHVIRTFADLETVRQIVVVSGMDVAQVRGEGLSTERLAALTVATKGLLARAGDLRVLSLEITDGVLFLFPTRDGAIVVLTQPKVNIGAVLAARADLEEAA